MDEIIEKINKLSKEHKEKQIELATNLSVRVVQLYNEQRMDTVLSAKKTSIR